MADFHDAEVTAPPRGRLCAAVVSTLAEEIGPSPTAFGASPASTFLCDGQKCRTAPGWWVAYAATLEVVSSPANTEHEELVELRFRGAHVHNGEPFTWALSMANDVYGVRRLVLHDEATYPEPLFNMLQFHAIAECRERLLQQTALRLGQQLPPKSGVRAVVSGVLAALGLHRNAVSGSGADQQQQHQASSSSSYPPPPSQPAAPYAAGGLAPMVPPSLYLNRAAGNENAPLQQPSALSTIADKIASTARSVGAPSTRRATLGGSIGSNAMGGGGAGGAGGSVCAAEAFAAASSHAAAVTADGTTAALRSAWGVDDTEDSSLGLVSAAPGSRAALGLRPPVAYLSEDDQLDSLRARLPNHSTESLRQMLRNMPDA